MLGVR